MDYKIRKKERKDCADIAHVVTIAWNETYRGIVPDEFLDNLYNNEEERAKNSYNNFDEKENHQYVLEVDNKVVGFIENGSWAPMATKVMKDMLSTSKNLTYLDSTVKIMSALNEESLIDLNAMAEELAK